MGSVTLTPEQVTAFQVDWHHQTLDVFGQLRKILRGLTHSNRLSHTLEKMIDVRKIFDRLLLVSHHKQFRFVSLRTLQVLLDCDIPYSN